MSKQTFQHTLTVRLEVAEDISYADIQVFRHYTDGTMESAGVTLTPADFDDDQGLLDMAREILVNLAEQM